jgi:hypothetical protein
MYDEQNNDISTEQDELSKEDILATEQDFIDGLLAAVDEKTQVKKTIEIAREGKVYFRFDITGLDEPVYNKCRKQATEYKKVRPLGGMKMPEETDTAEFRSRLILEATLPDAKLGGKKIWEHPSVKKGLEKKFGLLDGWEVVDKALRAGEKEAVVDKIDELSGYDSDLEETAKK